MDFFRVFGVDTPSSLPQMMSRREVLAPVEMGGGPHPEAQLTLWGLADEWCKLW